MSIAGKQTGSDDKTAQKEKKSRSHIVLIASYTQGVGDAIDVVEPGGDERDLQNGFVIEANGVQVFVISL
jgi:hypothetical protein